MNPQERRAPGGTDASITRPALRVLYVNHSLATGGIETMIRDFALRLKHAHWEPEVAVFQAGGSLENDLRANGVPVVDLSKREGLDPGLVRRMRRLLRDHAIDVVHSNNYSAWLYSVLASIGLPRTRVVHTEHSSIRGWRRRWLERQLARGTDAIVAVSRDVERGMVDDIGVARTAVRMIVNGVDTARFRRDDRLRQSARSEYGLRREHLAFGVVARLAPVKALEVLLDAFAMVWRRHPEARLLIAGDGPCRDALRAQGAALALSDAVRFLGEVQDPQRVMNSLDVYVLSSDSEGMNLTLLEAMASSLPVVATAVGGNPEVVDGNVTGLLVPRRSPEQLAQAMARMIEEPGMRARMGECGADRVRRTFSQDATFAAYLRLYEACRRGR